MVLENLVGNKWVFLIKHRPEGSINKYKALHIAKGFRQQASIDFHDTFIPVAKCATICLVLNLTLSQGWSPNNLISTMPFLVDTSKRLCTWLINRILLIATSSPISTC